MCMSEEKAKEVLGESIVEFGLNSLGWYLSWEKGDEEATLDGRFTVEQLEAIAWWMRNKNLPTP